MDNMRKFFFTERWQDILAYIFFSAGAALFVFFLIPHACSGLGCLVLFGLTGISMCCSLIFIITAFIRFGFIKRNLMIAVIWVLCVVVMFCTQVRMGSRLAQGYAECKRCDACLDSGGIWHAEGDYCEISPEAVIWQDLFNTILKVPETENLIAGFNEIKSSPECDYVHGIFSDRKGGEKGSVAGFYNKMKLVAGNLFVMPFAVDYGGSGSSFYLGLFTWKTLEPDSGRFRKEIKSIDSCFIGNRISIDKIRIFEDCRSGEKTVAVNYSGYSRGQNLAAKPEKCLTLFLNTSDVRFNDTHVLPCAKADMEVRSGRLGKSCIYHSIIIPCWHILVTYKSLDTIDFLFENNDDLFMKTRTGKVRVMKFSKIGPETVDEAIRYMAFKNTDKLPEGCVIKNYKELNRWAILAPNRKHDKTAASGFVCPLDAASVKKRYFTSLGNSILIFVDTGLIHLESVDFLLDE